MLVLSRSSERRSERESALWCDDEVECVDDTRGSRGALSRSLMLHTHRARGWLESSQDAL